VEWEFEENRHKERKKERKEKGFWESL